VLTMPVLLGVVTEVAWLPMIERVRERPVRARCRRPSPRSGMRSRAYPLDKPSPAVDNGDP
jgi:hypothetical protein